MTENVRMVESNNSNNNKSFTREIIILLIGALIGSSISLCTTLINDYYKNKKVRTEIAEAIYIDVLQNVTDIYTKLRDVPQKIMLANLQGNLMGHSHDSRIFDAYISQLSLLSIKDTQRIINFYTTLKNIDDGVGFAKEVKVPPNNYEKIFWTNYIYEACYKVLRDGHLLLLSLEKDYGIDPNQFVQSHGNIAAYRQEVLSRDPDLKNKLPEQRGTLRPISDVK